MADEATKKRSQGPSIPVHNNRRTVMVRMSKMNGDKLPQLRNVERPEFSNRTRHYNGLVRTHMWKNVNLMYKEHVIALNKVQRGQDQVFKILCRVTRDRRNARREEYVRHQEDGWTKSFIAPRILMIMRTVVEKFRQNVKRKRKQRSENEKRNLIHDQDHSRRRESLFIVTNSRRGSLMSGDEEDVNTDLADINKLKAKLQLIEQSARDEAEVAQISDAKQYNGDKRESRDRKMDNSRSHSAGGNKKKKKLYSVQTAENRDRFGKSILDSESTTSSRTAEYANESEDPQIGILPTKAVEVSKDAEHHTLLKRSASGRARSSKHRDRKRSAKKKHSQSSNMEVPAPNSRQVSFAMDKEDSPETDTDSHPQTPNKSAMNRGRRKSVFEKLDPEDPEAGDFGWFTFGNPRDLTANTVSVDTDSNTHSRTSSGSRTTAEKQKSVILENESVGSGGSAVSDVPKESAEQISLPHARRRKITMVGEPPSVHCLQNMTDTDKESNSRGMDVILESVSAHRKDKDRKSNSQEKDVKHKQNVNKQEEQKLSQLDAIKPDPRLIKRKDDLDSTENSETIKKVDTDFAVWYPVSKKEKKTYFLEPLKKRPTVQLNESNADENKSVSQSTTKLASDHKHTSMKGAGRECKGLDDEMSANMVWVLKQEEKYKNSRYAKMLNKEEVLHYKLVSHNKLVSEKVQRKAGQFVAPSHKEHYLQKKLKKETRDSIVKQRIKMAQFFQTVTVGFGKQY